MLVDLKLGDCMQQHSALNTLSMPTRLVSSYLAARHQQQVNSSSSSSPRHAGEATTTNRCNSRSGPAQQNQAQHQLISEIPGQHCNAAQEMMGSNARSTAVKHEIAKLSSLTHEADEIECATTARQFSSGVFPPSSKKVAADASAGATAGPAARASPSRGSPRSQSTPRSGRSLGLGSAVPGRARAVLPAGSSVSSVSEKLASQSPLTANMATAVASRKVVGSVRSSSTSRATPGRDATGSGVGSPYSRPYSSGVGSRPVVGRSGAAAGTGVGYSASAASTAAAAGGPIKGSSTSSGNTKCSRPASTGLGVTVPSVAAQPQASIVQIKNHTGLERLLSRHQQQHSVLGKDFGAAAPLAQPECAAAYQHPGLQQADNNATSSSQQAAHEAAVLGAGSTELHGVRSPVSGREYLQRLQQQRFAASTANMHAVASANNGSSSSVAMSSGGNNSDAAVQHSSTVSGRLPYATVAAAAAAAPTQRISIGAATSMETSPLMHCRPTGGTGGRTRVGVSTQQQQQQPHQEYKPALYTAERVTGLTSSATCSTGIHQQRLPNTPREHIAGLATDTVGRTGGQQQQQQLYKPGEYAGHADLRRTSSAGSQHQQPQQCYNPEQYTAGATGTSPTTSTCLQPQQQQVYSPEQLSAATRAESGIIALQQQQAHHASQYAAAEGGFGTPAAAVPGLSSVLQRNQQQLAGKLVERLAAGGSVGSATLLPAADSNSSGSTLHDASDHRAWQRVTPVHAVASTTAVVSSSRYTAEASYPGGVQSADAGVAARTAAANTANTMLDLDRASSHAGKDQSSGSQHGHSLVSDAHWLRNQHSSAHGQCESAIDQQQSVATALPTAAGRRRAHSGSLTDVQLPQTHAVLPALTPHPLYTAQPPQQHQAGSASTGDPHSVAAATAPPARVSDTGLTHDNMPRCSSSGSSNGDSRSYASAYGSTSRSNSGSQVLYGTASSTSSWLATIPAAGPSNSSPFAQRYSDGGTASSGGAAAGANAAVMAMQHRCSSSSGGSLAGTNAVYGGSSVNGSQLPSPQQRQQQQQQGSLSRLASAASSSTMLASRQPSFLIGTQPLSDDPDDTGRLSVAQSPGASAFSRGIHSGYSAGDEADAEASRKAASQQFLSCNFDSRASSMTATEGQALPQQQQRGLQTGVFTSGRNCGVAAAAVQTGNRCRSGCASRQSQQSTAAGKSAGYLNNTALDSDTDVSEISSSISHCSSSTSSDSDDGATVQPEWRRRLGRGHGLSTSVSISTEDRSSSCGSGRELEHACSLGKQTTSSHLSVGISNGSVRGQLPQGCVGLGNLGNTCFMNSVLQCLNCLPELVAALLGPRLAAKYITDAAALCASAAGEIQWGHKAAVGPAMSELLGEMWSSGANSMRRRNERVVSPKRFLAAVSAADERWGDGCQQDSQEFLHSLLEQLQSECNRVSCKPKYKELSSHGTVEQQAVEAAQYARSWHDSLVDDLFGGQLQSTITCSSCKAQSHCFDPFLDLSVPIPKQQQVSLQDCLQAFVEQEVLSGSEQVKCSACKQTCDATKRLQIYSYPRLLVLTLKRFNSSGNSRGSGGGLGGGWLGGGFSPYYKNQTPVKLSAQQVLDLQPYCNVLGVAAAKSKGATDPRYQLLAVSQHSGCLGGGHYTAQGRSVVDGCWYDFNDSSVTPESHPSGPSTSAYVLFFRLLGK